MVTTLAFHLDNGIPERGFADTQLLTDLVQVDKGSRNKTAGLNFSPQLFIHLLPQGANIQNAFSNLSGQQYSVGTTDSITGLAGLFGY